RNSSASSSRVRSRSGPARSRRAAWWWIDGTRATARPCHRGRSSLQLDLAFDFVGEADPAERDRGPGGKLFVALEPALRQGLAHRLLDLALGAHAERLEELANATVEHVFVPDRLRRAIIRLSGGRRAAAFASPDCDRRGLDRTIPLRVMLANARMRGPRGPRSGRMP